MEKLPDKHRGQSPVQLSSIEHIDPKLDGAALTAFRRLQAFEASDAIAHNTFSDQLAYIFQDQVLRDNLYREHAFQHQHLLERQMVEEKEEEEDVPKRLMTALQRIIKQHEHLPPWGQPLIEGDAPPRRVDGCSPLRGPPEWPDAGGGGGARSALGRSIVLLDEARRETGSGSPRRGGVRAAASSSPRKGLAVAVAAQGEVKSIGSGRGGSPRGGERPPERGSPRPREGLGRNEPPRRGVKGLLCKCTTVD